MHEIVLNPHIHTPYSDGHGTHREIADAATRAGIDAVLVTDHNVWVQGLEASIHKGDKAVLMLIGEEIHDQARQPQKNHLLVFGAERELAPYAHNPQHLVDMVSQADGLSFIAHPSDPANPIFNEPDLSWVDWDVQGFTGIELWNGLSEFKQRLKSRFHALFYAYFPQWIASGPPAETLRKWDELHATGQKVAAIGGSDAHALPGRMGPIRRTIFPYAFHFRCINTHLLIPEPLSGNLEQDKPPVLNALRDGHAFVGYDLPEPTNGFRFTAQGKNVSAIMGDEISAANGVTLQIRLPLRTECCLLKNGKTIRTWTNRENCTHITTEAGYYRVEVYIHYLGKKRGWIFSNPIYVI